VDPRITRLADLLVNFSTNVQPGERLLVESVGTDPLPLVEEILRIATQKGALVFHTITEHTLVRAVLMHASEEQVKALRDYPLAQMKEMDCYIGIRGPSNFAELVDVPAQAMGWYSRYITGDVHIRERAVNTRWVVLRYPNCAMAQQGKKSLRAFEDYYFDVCTMDYERMSKAMDPLVALMERTDRVEVVGQGTELNLSIKGLPAIKCDGHMNIPDGEVFTAPVKDSVNGTICFNAGSQFEGNLFGAITVTFAKGRVVKVDAGADTAAVEAILNRDEGARFVGEFAIGVNPYVTAPMFDTLFDEKIDGSLHMALGNSYDTCDNTNKSQNHWDLVHIQRPEWGGGEIRFDGVLIRKDGRFVHPELLALNPAALGA
jgi:aminopeptidase